MITFIQVCNENEEVGKKKYKNVKLRRKGTPENLMLETGFVTYEIRRNEKGSKLCPDIETLSS